ncbi:hypothetical protein ABC733_22515 [Mangrovibacter sp. SLW1]
MSNLSLSNIFQMKEFWAIVTPCILPFFRFLFQWISGERGVSTGAIKRIASNINDNKNVLSSEEQDFLKNIK